LESCARALFFSPEREKSRKEVEVEVEAVFFPFRPCSHLLPLTTFSIPLKSLLFLPPPPPNFPTSPFASDTMGEPYTLPPVSGPKETIATLLDTSLLGRFQNLDQVRRLFFFSLRFSSSFFLLCPRFPNR
jgi:hypothetical protein